MSTWNFNKIQFKESHIFCKNIGYRTWLFFDLHRTFKLQKKPAVLQKDPRENMKFFHLFLVGHFFLPGSVSGFPVRILSRNTVLDSWHSVPIPKTKMHRIRNTAPCATYCLGEAHSVRTVSAFSIALVDARTYRYVFMPAWLYYGLFTVQWRGRKSV